MNQSSQIDPRERALVEALRAERQKQKISATALAAKLKMNRSTITMIESDSSRPTLWALLKIADGLGIKLSDVLNECGA